MYSRIYDLLDIILTLNKVARRRPAEGLVTKSLKINFTCPYYSVVYLHNYT